MADSHLATLAELYVETRSEKWTAKRANAFWRLIHKRLARRTFAAMPLGDTVFHFGPKIEGERLQISMIRISVPNRSRPTIGAYALPVVLAPHAIERLFMRLDTMEVQQIGNEITYALHLCCAMVLAAKALNLRQCVLPTASGAFLCTTEPGEEMLARTWIKRNDPAGSMTNTSDKWVPVIEQVEAELLAFVERHSHSNVGEGVTKLCYAAVGSGEEVNELRDGLVRALQPFWWLRDSYVPGTDRQGTLWQKAREQARKVSE